MLSDQPAKFGVHRPYGTGNNGVCNVSSNSNSNSNAEVPVPRFTNGTFTTSFFETLRAVCVELVMLLLHYDEFSHIKISFTEQSKSKVMP